MVCRVLDFRNVAGVQNGIPLYTVPPGKKQVHGGYGTKENLVVCKGMWRSRVV